MTRPSARDAVLVAAEKVVLRDGAAHLTLDAVAEAAGMSKGGLLYHFPNKSALLGAMLERLLSGYEERRAAIHAEGPSSPDGQFMAELEAGLGGRSRDKEMRVGAAMLAVLANEPGLIDKCREFHQARYARSCGMGSEAFPKLLLMLAVDGLNLLELLEVSPFSERQRARLAKQLVAEGMRIASTT